jgi:hypothetical protein
MPTGGRMKACRMEGDRLPRANAVQEPVVAWKLMCGSGDETAGSLGGDNYPAEVACPARLA